VGSNLNVPKTFVINVQSANDVLPIHDGQPTLYEGLLLSARFAISDDANRIANLFSTRTRNRPGVRLRSRCGGGVLHRQRKPECEYER
jgi:hypothetical protein